MVEVVVAAHLHHQHLQVAVVEAVVRQLLVVAEVHQLLAVVGHQQQLLQDQICQVVHLQPQVEVAQQVVRQVVQHKHQLVKHHQVVSLRVQKNSSTL